MTDHPILFSPPMIRALLDGRKTQTRRTLKTQPEPWATKIVLGPLVQPINCRSTGEMIGMSATGRPGDMIQSDADDNRQCGCGRAPWMPGDRLWVREEHYRFGTIEPDGDKRTPTGKQKMRFVASSDEVLFDAPAGLRKAPYHEPAWRKRLGRFMFRAHSRLTLVVTGVRVQRLQDISETDAIAEGGPPSSPSIDRVSRGFGYQDFSRSWFAQLWDSINGPGAWKANPWVTATTFTVHKCNIDRGEA